MGKHMQTHGVRKYAVTQYEDYRVQLFNDAKTASEEDRRLVDEVEWHLSDMAKVHDLALTMLSGMQQVLMSDELLAKHRIKLRLKILFGIESLKADSMEWNTMATVVARTRTGLEGDRRVKFARITAPLQQKPGGEVAYGAVQPRSVKELQKVGYLLTEKTEAIVRKNQKAIGNLEFDATDTKAEKQKAYGHWRKVLADSKRDRDAALWRDEKFAEKAVKNPLQADVYMGGIKLDMFTFVQRMQGGEQALVARTLVHEATHRFAGTEDHAYMKPDGSGPKPDTPGGRVNSDYTEKPIQPVDWLGNADSYAHFAYWVWKEGGLVTKQD